jgi:hypothetical protein
MDGYAISNPRWWHILESGDTKERPHTRKESGDGEIVLVMDVCFHVELPGLLH